MAEFKPNKEQQIFLDSDKSNLLVSASAGSGKTSTMIQKLIKIIVEKRIGLKELLVLTFTEAAANEIKQKLFIELSLVLAGSNDKSLISYLKKQLEDINNAEIGTLHSVCKKLITKYFYEIEESPDFTLTSDKESKYLLDTAFNHVIMSRINTKDEDFFEVYDCYNSKRNDVTLKSIVLSIIDYINNKPNYIEWINNTGSVYNTELKNNIACKYLLDYYKDRLKTYLPRIEKLIDLDSEFTEKYSMWLNIRKQFINEFLDCHDYVQASKILYNIVLMSKPQKSRNASVEDCELDDKMAKFNDDFGDVLKKIKIDIPEDLEKVQQNLINSKSNLDTILQFAYDVKKTYDKIKKKKNSLDFNDLEDKMLDLLEIENVRNILKNTYKYIFFDEYQDINEKQELILSKLVSGDNYYMIGDVKQSIYAFRQSSPHIFISKFNNFIADGVNNKLINFNTNYRSDKNILEFNNLVFDHLITLDTIGIDYKNNARFVTPKEFDKTIVSLKIIDTSNKLDDIDNEESESILIGNEISKLLTQQKLNGENYTYKDIAIIIRSRGTFVKTLVKTLLDMQIPVTTKVSSDFFATYEIDLLISILKVISNYKNDIPLSVVLKNLFDLDEMDLYKIRNSDKFDTFYDSVFNCDLEDVNIKDKLNNFNKFLDKSRFMLGHMTIYDYLCKMISDFDIDIKLKAMINGDEKISNMQEFLGLANNQAYKYNLDKFLEYLEFISKDSSLQSIGNFGNAVEIITIHHSKGLEYPAVIFAGLGKKFNINKDSSNLLINKDFGFALKSIDNKTRELSETIVRTASKLSNRKSEMDEEIRLLYVGMTRAKEKLVLTGCYDIDKFADIKYKRIYSLNNYLEFIISSVDSTFIRFFENVGNFVINEGKENSFDVEIVDINTILSDTNVNTHHILFDKADIDLSTTLLNICNNPPSNETFTIKNTVTNILKEEVDYENLNTSPQKLNLTDKVESSSALKLGTAYHTVMQFINFNENLDDIDELIKDLVSKNILDRDISKQIDIGQIFIAKEIVGKIIHKSHEVYKEKQFLMQENYNKLIKNSDNNTRVIIQGIIDLVAVTDDGAYLIDYKTNRTNSEEKLIDEYRLQLEIYKLAFEKATNIPIKRKFLYSFYMGKLIEII